MHRLLDYYEAVMRDGQVLPASGGLGQAPAQPAISADVYSIVLSGKRQTWRDSSLGMFMSTR